MATTNLDNSSREASKPMQLPLPVGRAIAKLGQDFALGRRRRHLSQASLAIRVGASVSTIKRIEQGDGRVPVHFFARVLHVFGELDRLAVLLDSANDEIGLTLADAQLPQRIRAKRATPTSGAL